MLLWHLVVGWQESGEEVERVENPSLQGGGNSQGHGWLVERGQEEVEKAGEIWGQHNVAVVWPWMWGCV